MSIESSQRDCGVIDRQAVPTPVSLGFFDNGSPRRYDVHLPVAVLDVDVKEDRVEKAVQAGGHGFGGPRSRMPADKGYGGRAYSRRKT